MGNSFADIMKKHSNSELLKITTELRCEYQEDAIIAADLELLERNLTQEQVKIAIEELQIKKNETIKKSEQPLTIVWKLLLLFFPGIAPFIFYPIFKEMGYNRISKEIFKWSLYGVLLYILGFLCILSVIYLAF